MTDDPTPDAVACVFCGHRYARPCSTLTSATNCGNYAFKDGPGAIGRESVSPVALDHVQVEALRIAEELNKLTRG